MIFQQNILKYNGNVLRNCKSRKKKIAIVLSFEFTILL